MCFNRNRHIMPFENGQLTTQANWLIHNRHTIARHTMAFNKRSTDHTNNTNAKKTDIIKTIFIHSNYNNTINKPYLYVLQNLVYHSNSPVTAKLLSTKYSPPCYIPVKLSFYWKYKFVNLCKGNKNLCFKSANYAFQQRSTDHTSQLANPQ